MKKGKNCMKSCRTMFFYFLSTVLLVSLPWGSPSAAQTKDPRLTAEGAVKSFYTFHFSHSKDSRLKNIGQRRRWLTSELDDLLLAEYQREDREQTTHPDEVPYIEGDVFTDSQEYPTTFRLGKVDTAEDRAKVTVTFIWREKTKEVDRRDEVLEVVLRNGKWLINDLVSSDGRKLNDLLKRKE